MAGQVGDGPKRGSFLEIGERTRMQEGGPDVDYLFAPLKRGRLRRCSGNGDYCRAG
jgi:hypothetical protein